MNKELLMKEINELYSNQVGKLFCEEEIRKAIDKHIDKHCYDCDIEEQTNNLLKELFGEK